MSNSPMRKSRSTWFLLALFLLLSSALFVKFTPDTAIGGSIPPTVPNLNLTKNDGDITVIPGQIFTYTLTYGNTGGEAAGVVINETVPAYTTFVGPAGWDCTGVVAGSTCTYELGTVANGVTGNVAFAVQVIPSPLPSAVEQVDNIATIDDENGEDSNLLDNTALDSTLIIAAPDLTLVKTDNVSQVTPGTVLTYRLDYRNMGTQDAAGVKITETVPNGTQFNADASSVGWSCLPAGGGEGAKCTLNVGSVAGNGGAGFVLFAVKVVNPAPAGLPRIVNSPNATPANKTKIEDNKISGDDLNPVDNLAPEERTTLNAAPNLRVTQTDNPTTVVPNDVIVYQISYSNNGNQDATGVRITEVVPANTKWEAAFSSPGWSCVPATGVAGATCTYNVAGTLNGGGASDAINFAVRVDNPVAAGANVINNTVTIADNNANGPDSNPADNTDNEETTLNATPELSLTKTDNGFTATPGSTIAYVLAYANNGNQGATGVKLNETLPAHTTFNAAVSSAGWSCIGNACTLNLGTLDGAASGVATFAVTVNNPVAAGIEQISNTATISDDNTNGADANPANNSASDSTPVTAVPDLALTKEDDTDLAEPGDTVVYTLQYTNLGNQGATTVSIQETVPANTTFVPGASSNGWNCPTQNAGSTCTFTLGAVAGGASGTVNFAVSVNSPFPLGVNEITNSASITDDGANDSDSNPTNNNASDTTAVIATPELNLSKSDGGVSVLPGDELAYTLNYANDGSLLAQGVRITETVPANTTFVGPDADWSCSPGDPAGTTCTHTIGNLAVGANGTLTFVVQVADPLPDDWTSIDNEAAIGSQTQPNADTGVETTPVIAAPDLTISKADGDITAMPGGVIVYNLSYANNGTRIATNVRITETVLANTIYNEGASTAGWSCTPGNNAGSICIFTVPELAVGDSGDVNFAVTVNSQLPVGAEAIENTARIGDDGAHGADPITANNSDSETTPVNAAPNLSLQKTDGGVAAEPGDTVVYDLTYANEGNQAASGVTLTETVPAHSVFNESASVGGWSCLPDNNANSVCTLNLGPLAAGASGTVKFAVTVNSPVVAGVTETTNTATIGDDGANGADSDPSNNTASDTTPIKAPTLLDIRKDDGGVKTEVGSVIQYALGYANNSTQEAPGVTITETVPAHTTFAGPADQWSCPIGAAAGTPCYHVVGDLDVGGSGTVTFNVLVNATVPANTLQIENTAAIGSGLIANADTSSETTPFKLPVQMTLTKSDNGITAQPGDTIGYALTYGNSGDLTATGVAITETVPLHTIFSGPATEWSCALGADAGSVCVHTVGALTGGTAASVNFSVTVLEPLPSGVVQVENTAHIGSSAVVNAVASSDTTPLTAAPDLSLTKSDGGATVEPGDIIVYVLNYANQGNQDATGVIVTEGVPAHTTFVATSSSPGWSCTGPNCVFVLGALEAGASGSLTFAIQVADPLPAGVPEVMNTATIADDSSNGPDANPANNLASDSTIVIGGLGLIATKTAALVGDADGNGLINPNDVLEYTVVIENTSSTPVEGAVFKDVFDVNTKLASDNTVTTTQGSVTSGNNVSASNVQINLDTIDAGATITITFRVRINTPLPANVTFVENQGLVETTALPDIVTDDPTLPGANDRTRTAVNAAPVLIVTKTDFFSNDADGDGAVSPGDRLLYQLQITNKGNAPATNIIVEDVFDPNTTLFIDPQGNGALTNLGRVTSGNQAGHTSVTVEIPTLPVTTDDDKPVSANIRFQVTINANINVNQVSNQATVTYLRGGAPVSVLSDDPDTPALSDSTETVIVGGSVPTDGKLFLPLIWK